MKYELKIYPDFNRFKSYFPQITDEQASYINEKGVNIRLGYSTDEYKPSPKREELQFDLMYTSVSQFNNLLDKLPAMLSITKASFQYFNELLYLNVYFGESSHTISFQTAHPKGERYA